MGPFQRPTEPETAVHACRRAYASRGGDGSRQARAIARLRDDLNGAEAIELAEQKDQPIHLLLTDVVMPGMSGRELANYLTAKRPDMSVVYMSGYTNDAIAHHGVLDSGIVLIEKPFSQETLIRKLREVLDRKEKVPA